MDLPGITHLQYLVLDRLADSGCPGRLIRQRLAAARVRQSGPAFYRMMSRLEDAGLAEGRYVQEVIEGQIIKERHYDITGAGRRAVEATRRFYLGSGSHSRPAPGASNA